MKNALLSVIMATFNEPATYIKDAIESILNQTYTNFELIIVDDSTNSDTIKTINSFKNDSRVIIIRDSSRMGFVRALNIGLRLAKGEYIARMDGDDKSVNNRFEKQIDYLNLHKDIDVLGGNMKIVNKSGTVISERKYQNKELLLSISSIFRSPVAHPTVMFRKTIVEKNFFYDESFKKAEDTEFWFRLRNNGFKIANLPCDLLYFRISDDLAKKRTVEHFSYNFKARYKNFSWKYFYVDIPSIVITKLYVLVPKKVISIIYSIENKKYS